MEASGGLEEVGGGHEMQREIIVYRALVRLQARTDDSLEDFIFDTVSELLSDEGVDLVEIDSVVTASSDQLDGRAISIMVTAGSVGGYARDTINLSSGSEHALYYQAHRILAGRTRLGLVVGWAKPSEAPLPDVDHLSLDPFFERSVRHDSQATHAMHAMAFQARSPVDDDVLLAIAKKNWANARLNPRSVVHGSDTRPPDGSPSGGPTQHPSADACAVLLVGDGSRRKKGLGARIVGLGLATDGYWAEPDRVPARDALVAAATVAYRASDIFTPLEEFDVIELMNVTPSHELMAYEALGLAPPGGAAELVRSGRVMLGGGLPVNPSGGLASGDCGAAAGLVRVCEAVFQVTGEAGAIAVPSAKRALAHASSGGTGGSHTVFVLESIEW